SSDSDIEEIINYRRFVNAANLPEYIGVEHHGTQLPKPPAEFKAKWWVNNTYATSWEKRRPFYPCSHEGPCDKAQCRCYMENINCEKTCACSSSCNRRFPGCSCAQTAGGRRVCGTDKCLCQQMNRECDADLCGSCGAIEILDPVNRYNEDVIKGKCCNVAIQRGVPKKTLLGHSEVHGFGLYTGEDVRKEDFLGEYKGEVIALGEANRRGIIYEKKQTMYLFSLNKKQEVDSTHVGNKTRFINNADPRFTNCYAKNRLCNTVSRIGMFANTDIKAGTELFFNYSYPKEQTKYFKEP
ncbi:SET domain-containing protein, partial [Trematosphaeria pertusa]